MIHISQEELFRKIEQEHQLESEQFSTGARQEEQREEQVARAGRTRASKSRANERLVSGCKLALTSAYSSSSSSTTPRHPTQDMSKTSHPNTASTTTSTSTTTRDSNNNNQTSAGCNSATATHVACDDEVQAVLITGCGSKIGSNIAVAFAERGLKVALVDFDMHQTEAVARECQDKSPKNRAPLQIVADISQLAEAHKVIDRTIEAFGRLDVLVNTVNNASLMEAKLANSGQGDDDPHVFEQYHKIIANNMHAVTYLCISAAPYLRKTKGSIVNVSSITNNETGSYKFAYCMSKAGISTLTKCLATDLAPDIKVICVSPKNDAKTGGELSDSPERA